MFDIIDITSQFISFVIMVNDVKLHVVGVFGATTYTVRRFLWSTLVNFHDSW